MEYYQLAGITFAEVVLTQCRVAFWYLYTILVPWSTGVDLLYPCVISKSLLSPPATAAGLAGVIILVILGLKLMRKHPVPAFGIFFFLIVLAPESLLIPQYLFCGYRAVLPMAGVLFVLAAVVAQGMTARAGKWRPMVATVLGVFIVCLAAMTFVQARSWSPLRVWKHAYDRLPAFSEQVEATPYMDVLGSYGLELKNTGNYARAVDVLNRVIAIDSPPNNFKKTLALVNKGLALIELGDRGQALITLRAAHESDPVDYWACFQLAQALLDDGKQEEGRNMLRKAIALNPRYLPARLRLAHLMRESGQVHEAIALFQEAVKANPRSASIQNAFGAVLEASGNIPLALESYRKAVRWEPQSATYHFNLARLLAQTGHVPAAIEHYEKAVQLKEAFGPAQANLGTLLLKSGKADEALVHLHKAAALIPNNPNLYVQAAIALMSLGRKAEASEQLEKALALNPRHKQAREYLDRLLAQ
jgi:tetratricopeptide (TPR) repeat protein